MFGSFGERIRCLFLPHSRGARQGLVVRSVRGAVIFSSPMRVSFVKGGMVHFQSGRGIGVGRFPSCHLQL